MIAIVRLYRSIADASEGDDYDAVRVAALVDITSILSHASQKQKQI